MIRALHISSDILACFTVCYAIVAAIRQDSKDWIITLFFMADTLLVAIVAALTVHNARDVQIELAAIAVLGLVSWRMWPGDWQIFGSMISGLRKMRDDYRSAIAENKDP